MSLELLLGERRALVETQVDEWRRSEVPQRLRAHDPSIWFDEPVPELENRLGWLELPFIADGILGDWAGFAAAARESGIEEVVVLGMGGSSLAPEVFEQVFGSGRFLRVLDTTHPDAIRRLAGELDRDRTLFVVSSKSGSTVETRTLFDFFWRWAGGESGDAGRHFVVITDPGSPLETLGTTRQVRRIFRSPVDVGGRYSALGAFGLVPAALSGVDIRALVGRASAAAELLFAPDGSRPLLELGAALGHLAREGTDKLTLVTSAQLSAFPAWLEQLVAESTGKLGKGVVPVVGEPLLAPEAYGGDRWFVGLLLDSADNREMETQLRRLAEGGHAVGIIRLRDTYDLGFELFRWQVAVALAGAVLEINPFDQPNVQLAKEMARAAVEGGGKVEVSLDQLPIMEDPRATARALLEWLPKGPPTYIALQAYLPPSSETDQLFSDLQATLRRVTGCATTLGYGPRFLHSTGQLHKGGPGAARFIQIIGSVEEELAIPGERIGFGDLIAGQADGDAAALLEQQRQVYRLRSRSSSDLASLREHLEAQR